MITKIVYLYTLVKQQDNHKWENIIKNGRNFIAVVAAAKKSIIGRNKNYTSFHRFGKRISFAWTDTEYVSGFVTGFAQIKQHASLQPTQF